MLNKLIVTVISFVAFTHRSGKSDTNNGDHNDDATAMKLKDQRTDDISSNDNRKVIPIFELLPLLRTRHDFQLLESKIQKWKESQVGPIQNILCNQIVLSMRARARCCCCGFNWFFFLLLSSLCVVARFSVFFLLLLSFPFLSFHFRLNTLKNGSLIMR